MSMIRAATSSKRASSSGRLWPFDTFWDRINAGRTTRLAGFEPVIDALRLRQAVQLTDWCLELRCRGRPMPARLLKRLKVDDRCRLLLPSAAPRAGRPLPDRDNRLLQQKLGKLLDSESLRRRLPAAALEGLAAEPAPHPTWWRQLLSPAVPWLCGEASRSILTGHAPDLIAAAVRAGRGRQALTRGLLILALLAAPLSLWGLAQVLSGPRPASPPPTVVSAAWRPADQTKLPGRPAADAPDAGRYQTEPTAATAPNLPLPAPRPPHRQAPATSSGHSSEPPHYLPEPQTLQAPDSAGTAPSGKQRPPAPPPRPVAAATAHPTRSQRHRPAKHERGQSPSHDRPDRTRSTADTRPASDTDRPSQPGAQPSKPLVATWTQRPAGREAAITIARGSTQLEMELVWVPGGTYQMGSAEHVDESPVRTFSVPGFYLAKYETTEGQLAVILGRDRPPSATARLAAGGVDWYTAKDACRRLAQALGPAVAEVRLPWEYEWEFAAKNGQDRLALTPEQVAAQAWVAESLDNAQLHPVGQKSPNAFGLFDILGNVAEWVEDAYQQQAYLRAEPRGPRQGTYGVLRGGCSFTPLQYLRATRRRQFHRRNQDPFVGFRIVVVPKERPQ